MDQKMIAALRRVDLFQYLDKEQLNWLAEKTVCRSYPKGSVLFYEGESPHALTILSTGELSLYKSDKEGNKTFIHHFYPDSLIAEIALFDRSPYPVSALLESDSDILFIDRDKITGLIAQEPKITLALIRSLTQKIRHLEHVIHSNIILDSTARTANYLMQHDSDITQMKKRVIALKLHMTPATLSRILKKFKTLGLIEERGQRIIITNTEGLRLLYTV